jgi:phospholipase C
MGYYTKRELSYYYKLYSNFAIGDRFFCSVLTQTFPNRYYLLAGTSFGHIRNAIPNLSGAEYTQRSVFNLLDEAGVTWRIYFSDLPFGGVFGYVRTQGAANLVPVAQFAADAQAGNLPQVTFVDPRFLGTVNVETDEHPPANVQVGQKFVADVINAVLASPLWPRAAVFLTYDEHGGFYDHVPPPAACLPDDIPPMLQPNDVPGAFDRYGIRVPAVVISPYARKRFVSHRAYDHTSILRFIETRFDLPALTRRDANADPMLELFDFDRPQMLKPPRLPPAVIDEKQRQACEALSAPPNTEP